MNLNSQKNKPYRMTKQRAIIHEELLKLKTHPTADEIYKIVKKRLPKISLGTVYRNLEILNESGLVRNIESSKKRRYDAQLHEHYHIRCQHCGRLEDLPADVVEVNSTRLADECSFDITGRDFEFFGVCPDCSKSN